MKPEIEFKASAVQESLWLANELSNRSDLYNMSAIIFLNGPVESTKIESSLSTIILKHEILRTNFEMMDSGLIQKVYLKDKFDYNFIDLSKFNKELQKQKIEKLKKEQRETTFNLQKDNLCKFLLIKKSHDEFFLLVTMHHIINDGVGLDIFVRELSKFYSENFDDSDKMLDIQYGDYSEWDIKENKFTKKDKNFWLSRVTKENSILDLPFDFNKKDLPSFVGGKIDFKINKARTLKIKKLALNNRLTKFNVLSGTFGLFLAKLCNSDDFFLGIPYANRDVPESRNLIGYFVKTLPTRIYLNKNETFLDFLNRKKSDLYEEISHSKFNFEDLLKEANYVKHSSTSPIFQVMFSMQPHINNLDFGEKIESKFIGNNTDTAKYELLLNVEETLEEFNATIEYRTDLFKEESIHLFISTFLNFIDYIDKNADKSIDEITILGEKNYQPIFEGNQLSIDSNRNLLTEFKKYFLESPEKIAVYENGIGYSLDEIEEESNLIAIRLLQLGIQREEVVSILIDRSKNLLVAILGVLKAGGAYMPLMQSIPFKRIDFMIENSKSRFLLTSLDHLEFTKKLKPVQKVLVIEKKQEDFEEAKKTFDIQNINIEENQLACVYYTSGSTGNPKGVMLEHGSLLNRFIWMTNYFSFTSSHRFSFKTNVIFDFSIWELFSWIFARAELVILPQGLEKDPLEIVDFIEQNKIESIHFVPTMLSLFLKVLPETEFKKIISLKRIFIGGEGISEEELNCYKETVFTKLQIPLTNQYGPTEASVDVTFHDFDFEEKNQSNQIGKPIQNVNILLLYENNSSVPMGIVGEIAIGGKALARGYINDEKQTKEKFIHLPGTKQRVYKTGDLGIETKSGIIFKGRKDDQVKLRGLRIELSEILKRAREVNGVNNALVTVKENNLIFYYESDQPIAKKLREYLDEHLPQYMIPDEIIYFQKFPVLVSGKLDRKKIFEVRSENKLVEKNEFKEDSKDLNLIEKGLATIWIEKFEYKELSKNSDFFDLGANSIKVALLSVYLKEIMNVNVKVREIFEARTLENIAALIELKENTQEKELVLNKNLFVEKATPQQKDIWFANQLGGNNFSYNIATKISFSNAVDVKLIEKTIQQLVENQKILRTYFKFEEGSLQQVVDTAPSDYYQYTICNTKEELEKVAKKEAQWSFDLARLPLIRFHCVSFDNQYVLFLTIHHIINDGFGMSNLLRKFQMFYTGNTKHIALLNKVPQYIDYSKYLSESTHSKEKELEFITKRNEGNSLLSLPYDKECHNSNGDVYSKDLPEFIIVGVKNKAKELNVSPFIVYLASLSIFLGRISNQKKFFIGVPIANRQIPKTSEMIGNFVKTLPVYINLEKYQKMIDLIQYINEQVIQGMDSDYFWSSETINQRIVDSKSTGNNIFQTLLIYNPESRRFNLTNDIQLELENNITFSAKYPMSFDINDFTKSIEIEYNSGLFLESTIKKYVDFYLTTLSSVIEATKNANPLELSILNYSDKKLLKKFSKGDVVEGKYKNHLLEPFYESLIKAPENLAIYDDENSLTYQEVEAKSNQLANFLIKNGINQGDRVAISLKRSTDLIVAIFATLKVGAAYVPILPSYPINRKKLILDESKVTLILSEQSLLSEFKDSCLTINCDFDEFSKESTTRPSCKINPMDTAYIIFTSGSTGKPKGVVISHRAILNRLEWMVHHYKFNMNDTFMLKTAFIFDVSLWELFSWSFVGAKLYLPPEGTEIEPQELALKIEENNITRIHFVPSMFKIFVLMLRQNTSKLKNLKNVFLSGESVDSLSVQNFYLIDESYKKIKISNLYGPTEASVEVSYFDINPNNIPANIPIGKPITNVDLSVMNDSMELVPVNTIGQLFIGGICLADGYFDNENLTNQHFKQDKYGKRWYLTGDLAKFDSIGDIIFLGRKDSQIKLNGYRVEISEIETILNMIKNVDEGVIVFDPKRKTLFAFVTGNMNIDENIIYTELSEKLPKYMVPQKIITIPTIPKLPSGKTNRKQLLELAYPIKTTNHIKIDNSINSHLAKIWFEILEIESTGDGDFFEMGGDSLKAMNLILRISDELGKSILVSDIFTHTKLSQLSMFLEKVEYKEKNKIEQSEELVPSILQQSMWIQELLYKNSSALTIKVGLKFKMEVDFSDLESSIKIIIEKNRILRSKYFSVGGKLGLKFFKTSELVILNKIKIAEESELKSLLTQGIPMENNQLFQFYYVINSQSKEVYLILKIHHGISDGYTCQLIMNSLVEYLNSSKNQIKKTIDYYDYFLSSSNKIDKNRRKNVNAVLESIQNVVQGNLVCKINNNRKENNADSIAFFLSSNEEKEIEALCLVNKLSPYIFYLSAFELLIASNSSNNEGIIGQLFLGRNEANASTLGNFATVIPQKFEINDSLSVQELLEQTQLNFKRSLSIQDIPIELINEDKEFRKKYGRVELPEIFISYQTISAKKNSFKNQIELLEMPITQSNYQLVLNITKTNQVKFDFEFQTSSYSHNSIIELIANYKLIIKELLNSNQDKLIEMRRFYE